MPRSLRPSLSFSTALFIAFAGASFAEPNTAQITLDTATGAITITSEQADAPTVDWLTDGGTHFSGQLPELQSPTRINGWSEEASYLTGGGWLPKPADGTENGPHDITITVPATDQVAVTGTILEDRIEEDQRHLRFTFSGPATSLGIFAGRYQLQERPHQGQNAPISLRTYFHSEEAGLSDTYLRASGHYIDRFEAQIGPYPYAAFSVVSAPIPVGLGFAGLTYVGRSILPHDYMSERSLAHEILHSWWGNAVRVDYDAGNWSEGLTTFMADYGLAEDKGADVARQMRMDWLRQLALIAPEDMKPLTAFRSASHQSGGQGEGYGKAALVFHMLRSELGTEMFYAGLRQFYQDNIHKEASWAELQTAFETASARDLSPFFEQWLTRASLPRLHLSDSHVGADGALYVTLSQEGPVYDLQVPVVVETEAGRDTHTLRLSENTQSYALPLKGTPVAVHVDPDFDLARWPAQDELSPTLDNAFAGSGFNAALAAPDAEDAAQTRAILEDTLTVTLDWSPERPHDIDLIFGTTAQVDAFYTAKKGHAFPHAKDGAARVWLEKENNGQMTLYISADDLEDAAAQMRFLGYYGSKSYVSFENGSGHTHGVMPSQNSALRQQITP
ncbi:hypothetical protein J7382_08190 [Shimia sp. R11_0]|uniref:M1 family metallopeptidase n=1 Tax=Shimia sp. R11_0 TaxID=2821096 RepID=UPI001ADB7C72|nr:M1 family aminopeptidase [Shimia sp. R11_0]MBO9477508.1 hypothetical protein [Shimia sp. R11_0]